MNKLQSILTAIALVVLAVPCTHADGHHHAEDAHVFSAPQCEHCHACEEEPCAKPEGVVQLSQDAPVTVPVRSAPQIAVYDHSVPVSVPAPRPPERLLLLQTVQLLI